MAISNRETEAKLKRLFKLFNKFMLLLWRLGLGSIGNQTKAENRIDLMRAVLIGSGFAAYLAGINPHRLSDEELKAATDTYRLIRIRREQAMTGTGGPGDLTWIWPLSTILLLFLLLAKKRSK